MTPQLINLETGGFTLDNSFMVSPATRLEDLQDHYGKDSLKKSEFAKDCWYLPRQIKIEDLYFVFRFYFENELLKSIGFEIEEEAKERNPWGNNRDFETNWIARQTGDESGFNWDTSEAGKQYHLPYPWGSVGMYYDFKNGTYESSLSYHTPEI